MAWYNAGTVSVTNNSTAVTGSGTAFNDYVDAGQGFRGPDGLIYEIASVVSATALTLATPYKGATAAGQAYSINPAQGYLRDLALQAASLVLSFATVRDGIGQGKFPDGTVGTPGIRFASDEDTGIYRSGTNVLAFVTNGTERLRIDASGNVGIGTTNPSGKLHVEKVAADANWFVRAKSVGIANDSGFWVDASNNVELPLRDGSGSLTCNIRASGNSYLTGGSLGIGTSSPSARVHASIAGASVARFTNSQSNGGDWEFKLGGGGFIDRAFMITDKFGGADNVRFTINSAGKIGVGTTSPSETLHLYDSAAANWVVQRIENGAGFMKIGAIATTGNAYIESASGKSLIFKQNGTDRFLIDGGNGNLYGYGTSGALLFLSGDTSSGAYHGIALRNNYGTGSRDAFGYYEILNENSISVASDTVVILANGACRREWTLTPSGSRTADRRATKMSLDVNGLYAGSDNTQSLGWSANRWSVVYAATGTINTSDRETKQDIGAIPDEWLDAWGDLDWQRYKFIDAVQSKGDDARWHIGLIAQDVRDVFIARNLDAQAIGLLCFDQWEDQHEPIYETVTKTRLIDSEVRRSRMVPGEIAKTCIVEQERTNYRPVNPDDPESLFEPFTETIEVEHTYYEMGEVEEIYYETAQIEQEYETQEASGETRVTLKAGQRWGLRYDECQAMEAAYQRREIERLRALVTALQAPNP